MVCGTGTARAEGEGEGMVVVVVVVVVGATPEWWWRMRGRKLPSPVRPVSTLLRTGVGLS